MNKLMHGDCIEIMKQLISDNIKVDAIITDPPYGTTDCRWDSIIPFDLMWKYTNKLIKRNGAIVFFGVEPFSSKLRLSNLDQWRYDWIWEKEKAANFIQAKYAPQNKIEIISVFGDFRCTHNAENKPYYYPQGIIEINKTRKNCKNTGGIHGNIHQGSNCLQKREGKKFISTHKNYPKSIIKFNRDKSQIYHPTQKPVALLEYLIKTYTKENEMVLDFTMGSGSTGVACRNTNRNFIGIEKDEKYFKIAKERIHAK